MTLRLRRHQTEVAPGPKRGGRFQSVGVSEINSAGSLVLTEQDQQDMVAYMKLLK